MPSAPPPIPADVASGLALLREAGALLVVLAGATAGVLLWLRGWSGTDRQSVRHHAARLSRLPWTARDAQLVLAAMLSLVLAAALNSRAPGTPPPPPPSLGTLLLSATLMPGFAALLCLARATASDHSVAALLNLRRDTWRRDVPLGLLGGLALLLPALLLSWGCGRILLWWGIPLEQQDALRWLRDPRTSATVRAALALQALFVAPVLEEVLYRGVLLAVVLRNHRTGSAVALVSVLFAAFHLQAQVFLPLAAVGVACALALLRTGSLAAAIAMHMAFNTANLVLVLASP